jgi:hypothetical protein
VIEPLNQFLGLTNELQHSGVVERFVLFQVEANTQRWGLCAAITATTFCVWVIEPRKPVGQSGTPGCVCETVETAKFHSKARR